MKSVKVTADNAASITTDLAVVMGNLRSGKGTIGKLLMDTVFSSSLDVTMANVKQATGGLKDNMEAAKHNFLLKGYFKNRGYEDSADLGKDEVVTAPEAATIKDFTYQSKDLFDKQDSAKLKGQKTLSAAGQFLAANDFGVAVIEVSSGKIGSAEADLTLAQARAMVVRDYIVQHFGFDDTKLKTLSLGKQTGETSKADWGEIKILIYPAGTPIPADKSQDQTSPAAPQSTSTPQ
jgi:outer membrane protein OmpA-like peptidoglycan-associated protein